MALEIRLRQWPAPRDLQPYAQEMPPPLRVRIVFERLAGYA